MHLEVNPPLFADMDENIFGFLSDADVMHTKADIYGVILAQIPLRIMMRLLVNRPIVLLR